MNKEDHDRERMRWFLRLEEIESRLADSERLNSDMHQIRAELNKKIVELEKSQRPLIEQNRKVNERNKALQQEVKKLEQKLCHTQDDYLTLKNAHEKLMKEHVQLKEKRAYPEKLEELERYRAQVLEYSKCITALRSSGLERDRRYELLVQKFKRLRRCVRKDVEDDRQSLVGSDCSAESSVNLDKIAEDLESFNTDIELNYQTLYRENTELQKEIQELKLSPALLDENLLRDQLKCANTTIAQQQFHINNNKNMEQSEDLQSKRKRKKLQELETEELRKKVIESDSIRENMAEEMRTTSKELTKLKIKLQNRESELEQEKKLAESLNQQLQAIVQTHQMVKNTSSRTEEELAKTKTSYQECKAKVTEELRTMSKELAKLKYKLQTKEAELNQERKLTEGLNQQLQEVVETHQHMKDSSGRTEGELEKAKELYNECKAKVENLEKEKVELKTELDRLSSEYKKFRDEQRPLIR
ncbi:unnamed protein product [Heligmosomoides polygyrus]|uniref:Centrosomal protein of n=1 Tax=Heligmosomoides polygyrus TaxID=6339 RepID=A0A3P8B7V1_HELPZ|nr:unnamed protein product [Heligmosomoides polygyrus]